MSSTLYQIFEFETGYDADLVNAYIKDRGFIIRILLGRDRDSTVPQEIRRAYRLPPREGYQKVLCSKEIETTIEVKTATYEGCTPPVAGQERYRRLTKRSKTQ